MSPNVQNIDENPPLPTSKNVMDPSSTLALQDLSPQSINLTDTPTIGPSAKTLSTGKIGPSSASAGYSAKIGPSLASNYTASIGPSSNNGPTSGQIGPSTTASIGPSNTAYRPPTAATIGPSTTIPTYGYSASIGPSPNAYNSRSTSSTIGPSANSYNPPPVYSNAPPISNIYRPIGNAVMNAAPAAPLNNSLRQIRKSELAEHRTMQSLWIGYKGYVYDATDYKHSGGIQALLRGAGKDATQMILRQHSWVKVDEQLKNKKIGILVTQDSDDDSD